LRVSEAFGTRKKHAYFRRKVSSDEVKRAVDILRAGGLVALPTETVYGLAADAGNELAVRRIFAVKGRPSTHPLIVHLWSAAQVLTWADDVSPLAQRLADAFWPGPLTLVFRRTPHASDAVTGGQDTVALRVPSHPLAHAVLAAFGGGLAAPSANRFGKVSPTTAAHVREDLGGEVDLILDGGPAEVGVESTIVDVSGAEPAILRPGGVPKEALEAVARHPLPLRTGGDVRAPGMLPSHYAPRAGVLPVSGAEAGLRAQALGAQGRRVAVLGASGLRLPAGATLLPVPEDAAGLARVLYARLREVDAGGYDVVLVCVPPAQGLGLAVLDRLARASAQ
jgi:L-threonylcarbamoyladenylate synthase